LRSFYLLGDAIEAQYGQIDVAAAKEMLSLQPLVDDRDSMNAVIYEPQRGVLHFAMGQVPATAGPFVEFDFLTCMALGSCE
jgi:hypothetical protein